MSSEINRIVAKFGGSSMAQPELVAQRIREYDVEPDIVVVSAPGKDKACDDKVTDLLLQYGETLSDESRVRVIDRMTDIAIRTSLSPEQRASFINEVRSDLVGGTVFDSAVAALGEKWSAQLLASITNREYVDAADVIQFSSDGALDETSTKQSVSKLLDPGEKYVIPGFYGSLPSGSINTFERGGSDITGAIIARMYDANEYHNWSDVEGFFSANPRVVPEAYPISQLTYREARELANGGNELLNREVARHLGSTGVKTIMHSTFTGRSKTEVVDERDWRNQPIVGVSGIPHMTELQLSQYGIEECAGTTQEIFELLARHGIPYQHAATSTDDISIYAPDSYRKQIAILFSSDKRFSIDDAAMIHIVGEGLRNQPSAKAISIGRIAQALGEDGIGIVGMTDTRHSPGTTFFVAPNDYDMALQKVHDTFLER